MNLWIAHHLSSIKLSLLWIILAGFVIGMDVCAGLGNMHRENPNVSTFSQPEHK